jgi:excisionase family DNA binding protein
MKIKNEVQNQSKSLFDIQIWLDSHEAASYLRISVNSLRIRVMRGQVPVYRLGKRLRFKRSELKSLVENTLKGASHDN